MTAVPIPVIKIQLSKVSRSNDQEILRVLLLGRFCEVKGAGDDGVLIDDHDLIVGDRVLGIDIGGDSAFTRNVLPYTFRALTLV
jgi:hypothetical protein